MAEFSTAQSVHAAELDLDAVIGMYPVVHRLRSTVVNPWISLNGGDRAVRAPHRVLLYGSPDSGGTFIAQRLVAELEQRAGVTGVVLTDFDTTVEADPDAISAVLDAPETKNVVVVAVSYQPWNLPVNMVTGDGFDRLVFVSPPDWEARRFRLWESPWGRTLSESELDDAVVATEGWSGPDLTALGACGPGARLDDDVPLTIVDLLARTERGPAIANKWFESVRPLVGDLATYGRIDDLVSYLQRYRLL